MDARVKEAPAPAGSNSIGHDTSVAGGGQPSSIPSDTGVSSDCMAMESSWCSTPALAASRTPGDSLSVTPGAYRHPSSTRLFHHGAVPAQCKHCYYLFSANGDAAKPRKQYCCRLCGDVLCSTCACTRVQLYDSEGRQKICRVCEPCAAANPRLPFCVPNAALRSPGSSAVRLIPTQSPKALAPQVLPPATPPAAAAAAAGGAAGTRESGGSGAASPASLAAAAAVAAASSTAAAAAKTRDEELQRLRELHSSILDQETIGRRAMLEEMSESARRREMFEAGTHHCTKCQVCLTAYAMLRREHHCRKCYRSVCAECSRAKIDTLRICDWCISAPPTLLPACAVGFTAATRAAEYQHMAELMWQASQQENLQWDEEECEGSLGRDEVSSTPGSSLIGASAVKS